MTASLIRGNALAFPLVDSCVDLMVTSPPYFALRSYQDDGEHYDGQLGSEDSPEAFLRGQWAVADEVWRTLKAEGSAWWNYGDKYTGGGNGGHRGPMDGRDRGLGDAAQTNNRGRGAGTRDKSLMGLPWRFVLGLTCPQWYRNPIDPPGEGREHPTWILRAEVVWSKPNGLPESVTDRVRRSHEVWFHLTKQGRYFAAVDEIRESRDVVEPRPQHLPSCALISGPPDSLASPDVQRGHEGVAGVERVDLADEVRANQRVHGQNGAGPESHHEVGPSGSAVPLLRHERPSVGADREHLVDDRLIAAVDRDTQVRRPGAAVGEVDGRLPIDDSSEPSAVCTCGHTTYRNPLGKLPGSVWTIASEPLQVPEHVGVDHFAAYPQEWPRRIILGWSPSGICTACGEGRRPVVAKETPDLHEWAQEQARERSPMSGGVGKVTLGIPAADRSTTITGYACACPDTTAPTRPAVVLDPFGGTGTTAGVARALGRHGVHLDLSADYLRLARWRVFESGHFTKTVDRTNGERKAEGRADLVSAPYEPGSLFG